MQDILWMKIFYSWYFSESLGKMSKFKSLLWLYTILNRKTCSWYSFSMEGVTIQAAQCKNSRSLGMDRKTLPIGALQPLFQRIISSSEQSQPSCFRDTWAFVLAITQVSTDCVFRFTQGDFSKITGLDSALETYSLGWWSAWACACL